MKMLKPFTIYRGDGATTITMPRRARIVNVVALRGGGAELHAEVEENADTKALDTNTHARSFLLLGPGESVPEGAGFVGADARTIIYEIRP